MTEEQDRSGISDTSRFLVSGARQASWVGAERGRLHDAMCSIPGQVIRGSNVIIDTNSILQLVRPVLSFPVKVPAAEDFKASAGRDLDRADGIVLHQGEQILRR